MGIGMFSSDALTRYSHEHHKLFQHVSEHFFFNKLKISSMCVENVSEVSRNGGRIVHLSHCVAKTCEPGKTMRDCVPFLLTRARSSHLCSKVTARERETRM